MLRWGLLGTAHVNRRLIPAMRAARRSSVVAVASRDIGRARQYADEWSIPTAHGSYEALIRDAAVDAIYVPLPNSLHVEWTLRALDAGKHVLCEKPLALSADDVDRVAAVARARDRIVEECFMFRHEPLTHALVKVLAEGTIGPVTAIASGFTYEQSRQHDVRLVPDLGGGSLWDIGCYAVNVVRLVAGAEPLEAFGWSTIGASGVDDSFSGMLRFPGNVTATVHCSFRSSYRTWLEINGKAGMLRVRNPFKPDTESVIDVYREGALERSVVVEATQLLFLRLVEDFIAAALGDRAPVVSLGDSRGNAAALSALYASAGSGQPVGLDP